MKTLYVNIDGKQIEGTDSIDVLNYNLLYDFFFYLGEAIVGDSGLDVDKIALIKDFNTPENALDFDKILKQWEGLKLILFNEKPEGEYEIILPDGYIDWLHYNSNGGYTNIYNLISKNDRKYVVNIDVEDFYTSCIKGDLLRKIKKNISKNKLNLNEIVIDVKQLSQSSAFVNCAMELLNVKIVAGSWHVKLLACIMQNGKYGYIDVHGHQVIPCIYDYASFFSEGLACVKQNGKWGYIDVQGRQIIPCIYDNANPFNEGLALVEKDDKYGYIDVNGHQVIPCIYEFAQKFTEGLAYVNQNGKRGYINAQGRQVISCKEFGAPFREGFASVMQKGKWGYLDSQGCQVIPCIYDFVGPFCDGLAIVEKNDKYGYIDLQGHQVIPYVYEDVSLFSEGLAHVKQNGKWGYINVQGHPVISCMFQCSYSIFQSSGFYLDDARFRFVKVETLERY